MTNDDDAPTVSRALPIAVVRGVLYVLGTAVLSRALLGEGVDPFGGSGPALALIAALLLCDVVGTNLALWKIGRQTPRTLGWIAQHVGRDVVLGIGGFVVCAAFFALVMLALGGQEAIDEVTSGIAGYTVAQRVSFVVIGVFGACAAEESLYRGYLQPALARKLGVVGGVVVTALLFSALHFNPNPVSLVVKFFFGVIYGVLALRTGSLVAPGVTHALVWAVIGAA